jgi:hypothetical protein
MAKERSYKEKVFFSRTSLQILVKLFNHPEVKGCKSYYVKSQVFIKGEIITKCKLVWGI